MLSFGSPGGTPISFEAAEDAKTHFLARSAHPPPQNRVWNHRQKEGSHCERGAPAGDREGPRDPPHCSRGGRSGGGQSSLGLARPGASQDGWEGSLFTQEGRADSTFLQFTLPS